MAGKTPIIFLHIPKTAGSTVHKILHNEYKGLKHFLCVNYKEIELFEKLSIEEKKEIKIIRGHLPFGVHENYPGAITYFTFFRNPIKRSISDFNYLYHYKKLPFHAQMVREKCLKEQRVRWSNCLYRIRMVLVLKALQLCRHNKESNSKHRDSI